MLDNCKQQERSIFTLQGIVSKYIQKPTLVCVSNEPLDPYEEHDWNADSR